MWRRKPGRPPMLRSCALPGLLPQSCFIPAVIHWPALTLRHGCELCHGGPRRPPALPPAARPAPCCCVTTAAQLPSPSLLLLCSTPSSVCRLCSALAAQAVLPNCSKAAQWLQKGCHAALHDPLPARPGGSHAARSDHSAGSTQAERPSAQGRHTQDRADEQDHKLACSFREMPRTGPRWIRFIRCCTTKRGRQGGGDHVGTQHASRQLAAPHAALHAI